MNLAAARAAGSGPSQCVQRAGFSRPGRYSWSSGSACVPARKSLQRRREQKGPAGDRDRHRIAGPGQFVRKTREHPRAGENPFVLKREECFARIGGGRQPASHGSRRLELGKRVGSDDALQRRSHAHPSTTSRVRRHRSTRCRRHTPGKYGDDPRVPRAGFARGRTKNRRFPTRSSRWPATGRSATAELIPTVVDRNLCRLPPAASSPACGGGRVGGRFRASGSGGANAAIRNVRRVRRGGGRSPAKARHAERPTPNPSRRAGGEHDGTPPNMSPASCTLV